MAKLEITKKLFVFKYEQEDDETLFFAAESWTNFISLLMDHLQVEFNELDIPAGSAAIIPEREWDRYWFSAKHPDEPGKNIGITIEQFMEACDEPGLIATNEKD